MCNACDLGILLGDTLHRIDDDDHHVRPLHRGHGADDAVALQLFLDLVFPA